MGAAIRVLCLKTQRATCASFKSNMGHLEAAAGAAGLVSLVHMSLDLSVIVGNAQLKQFGCF